MDRPPYARRRAVALAGLLTVIAVPILLTRGGDGDTGSAATPKARPDPAAAAAVARATRLPIARALGQTLAGTYDGRTPPEDLVRRVRAGQLGGVILFADNTAGGVPATRRAVDRLQAAAKAGGNPRLLIMTDQEGGLVKRLPGAPDRAPAAMTSVTVARDQGAATGRLLRRAGVTMDLAPVADVTRVRGSFLQTRSFGTDPAAVARRACAFAAGLRAQGVAATLKHFPGLGRARGNTDDRRIAIDDPAAAIRSDWAPYARCAGQARTAVMMSSATYPALVGADTPAVLNVRSYARELPRAGVPSSTMTISDDLDAGALAGRARPAARALRAGLDLLLFARAEGSSARAFRGLLAQVRSGAMPQSRVRDAAAAVLRLKGQLPSP